MRLICPNCQQSVAVPDAAAGLPTPCPLCGKTFTPPALTGAAIDAAPPPAPKSEVPKPQAAPPPAPAPTPVPAAVGSPYCRLALRRDVASWLAPAALVIVFVLTFFSWDGVYPNGRAVYTQSAWRATIGDFKTVDTVGESVMKQETTLQKNSRWSGWLMFYFILLIPTIVLAVAERAVPRLGATVPNFLRAVWPHRQFILALLCAALLLLLLGALFFHFGLETAAANAVEEAIPAPTAGPDGSPPSTPQIEMRNVLRDVKLASYALERTNWLTLAVLAHLVALFGAGLTLWLDRHPNMPEPHIDCYC